MLRWSSLTVSTTWPPPLSSRQTLSQQLAFCNHLIVDISDTEFIDSSTIAVLVNAKQHADLDGCKFSLVLGTAPIVERALEITGVLPTLNRFHSLDEALSEST